MELSREQITEARERKGWSKAKLAREADMNAATISQIENGRIIPYPGQVEKIARALGIEV
jgi:Predicted transcription factor, homolog of eukaryotic MBF1